MGGSALHGVAGIAMSKTAIGCSGAFDTCCSGIAGRYM
jgi:hypothetical protein